MGGYRRFTADPFTLQIPLYLPAWATHGPISVHSYFPLGWLEGTVFMIQFPPNVYIFWWVFFFFFWGGVDWWCSLRLWKGKNPNLFDSSWNQCKCNDLGQVIWSAVQLVQPAGRVKKHNVAWLLSYIVLAWLWSVWYYSPFQCTVFSPLNDLRLLSSSHLLQIRHVKVCLYKQGLCTERNIWVKTKIMGLPVGFSLGWVGVIEKAWGVDALVPKGN